MHKAELAVVITGDFDTDVAKNIFIEKPTSSRLEVALVRNIGNGLAVVNQHSSWVYTSDIEFEESLYQEISNFMKKNEFAPHKFSALRQTCGEISILMKCVITPDLKSNYEPRFAMDTHLVSWLSKVGGNLIVDFVLKDGDSQDTFKENAN